VDEKVMHFQTLAKKVKNKKWVVQQNKSRYIFETVLEIAQKYEWGGAE
jgi:hypothetical protein